ncbi:MAG TPA: antitoxin [Terriglobia bacterium]|nr:antitoxin [Terriglobia bacterium]
MRTTISLDDDVFAVVTRQAKARGVSLGKTISDLVRRGLNAPTPSQHEEGLIVFRLPADSPTVTTDDVRRIESEGA